MRKRRKEKMAIMKKIRKKTRMARKRNSN